MYTDYFLPYMIPRYCSHLHDKSPKMNEPQAVLVNVEPVDFLTNASITDLFTHYCDKSWSILLDSANSEHQNSRYDIIVSEPIVTLVTNKNVTTISNIQSGQSDSCIEDPITLLKHEHHKYFGQIDNVPSETELPFHIGALGLFGYDLGKQFEPKVASPNQGYQTPDMAIGLYTWSIVKDNQTGIVYLSWLSTYPKPNLVHLRKQDSRPISPFKLGAEWSSNMSAETYAANISRVHQYLYAGDCYQINLAQRFESTYTGDEWQAYLKLRDANQAPFSSFIRLPDAAILSISPERFISVKNNVAQSKPIKGTRPRALDSTQDAKMVEQLLSSEKDQAENLMIVDLLRNDLSKHCQPHSVQVPQLFEIESFKAVHHMVSTVTGKLNADSSAFELLRGAFPGGSITGAPKIRAMQIIDELEPDNRNIYCGSIGFINFNGDMDTNICIRTLLCEKSPQGNHLYCWAGGGIVIDSNAKAEYQESLDKVSKILPVLQ